MKICEDWLSKNFVRKFFKSSNFLKFSDLRHASHTN